MAITALPRLIASIALLAAAAAAALLLAGAPPAAAQTSTTDYDRNDNGLIDISSIAQLSAIRHDLDGNGDATHADYIAAFPNRDTNAASRMGCPMGACTGYELTQNLTFPAATSSPYNPWTPITGSYNAAFDGNGYTLTNLKISDSSGNTGLFRNLGGSGQIRDVGLINPNVTTTATTGYDIGSLVGRAEANSRIDAAYVSGGSVVSANRGTNVGALAGANWDGAIRASYATARVRLSVPGIGASIGGLVGWMRGGSLSASYAAGPVLGSGGTLSIGGLVGYASNGGSISASYCDSGVSTRSTCVGSTHSSAGAITAVATTTAALQAPTGYTGIYANWNIDVTGDLYTDDPWNFGTTTTYPTLKSPTQRTPAPTLVDHDANDNGLIDVGSIEQLDAIRYDLNGDGSPEASTSSYEAAFPSRHRAAATLMGCPAGACTGYELTASLTLPSVGAGSLWTPIGTFLNYFTATLDGNGHTLTNLNVNMTVNNHAGLFQVLSGGAVVRDLGLLNPTVRSQATGLQVGSLAGSAAAGSTIQAVYVLGGTTTVAAAQMRGGGLVGIAGGVIRASYSTAAIQQEGSPANVYTGVLAGQLDGGAITASYAAGPNRATTGANSYHGGFVGQVQDTVDTAAAITDSYCDSEVMVVAQCIVNHGPGVNLAGATVTSTTAALQTPAGYAGIYAGWNLDLDGDYNPDYPWNFGHSRQYPKLNTPAQRARLVPPRTDYDTNNNGLIEIHNLAQLNAMRHDPNGNGDANHADYGAAFPNRSTDPAARMGCREGACRGYELMADLDLAATGSPSYNPWTPIGGRFTATFDGNGHTISNLKIEVTGGPSVHTGLFRQVDGGGYIREVGLINPAVTSTVASGNNGNIGGLVGRLDTGGRIDAAYVRGGRIHASGQSAYVGGLTGYARGAIRASYSTATVDIESIEDNIFAGGLVGWLRNAGRITASYAAGPVTDSPSSGGNNFFAGLAGYVTHGAAVSASYCDQQVTTRSMCVGATSSPGVIEATATTTAALQAPTGYNGIYANWNLDLDGNGSGDNPWDFGTPTDYPTLNLLAQDSPPPGGPRHAQPP